MKNNYIIVVILYSLLLSCGSSNNQKNKIHNIQNSITEFYIKIHEIDKSQRDTILANFKGLTKITSLTNGNKFNYEKGIYKISLNVSHTTTHLLLINDKNFKIIGVDNDLDSIVKEFKDFMSTNNLPYEIPLESYVEKISNILKDNVKIKERTSIKTLK